MKVKQTVHIVFTRVLLLFLFSLYSISVKLKWDYFRIDQNHTAGTVLGHWVRETTKPHAISAITAGVTAAITAPIAPCDKGK